MNLTHDVLMYEYCSWYDYDYDYTWFSQDLLVVRQPFPRVCVFYIQYSYNRYKRIRQLLQ